MKHLRLTQLFPHPDNRPLGINEEKVQQLAEMMKANGYDESKPIKARPNGSPDTYQIIEGEHRWRAAQLAGVETVPVFVKELSDEEALIELVAGNVQTGNDNIDIGVIALRLKDSHGVKYRDYAKKIGKSENTVSGYAKAGAVFRELKDKIPPGGDFCREDGKLEEIARCEKADWLWFYQLMDSKKLSKIDVTEISKRIRGIDKAANYSASVFDITELKQESATVKERQYQNTISLIEAIESCAGKLPELVELHRYSFTAKVVEKYQYQAREVFLSRLANTKDLSRPDVFKAYDSALTVIQQQTEANAERDKAHYENEANREAAEERKKAEWEAFTPEPGKWYELGRHRLYCGDNKDAGFIDRLPAAELAFADPPYNEGVAEWDNDFNWSQDYLADKAEIVAVTPGIGNINGFFSETQMPYKWSHSTWIKNGMTRGALGFGNWIYTAIFSNKESIHRNAQDFESITIKTSESETHYHPGKKPGEYMRKIIELFTEEGAVVIDSFLGSGTTLIECESLGRTCYGAEKAPAHCKKIMEQFNSMINDDAI